MKKLLLLLALAPSMLFAQEGIDYNKWSIEADAGILKPAMDWSDNNWQFAKGADFLSANLGARYMFNTKFGLKLNYGFNLIQDLDGAPEQDYTTNYHEISLQFVNNLSNALGIKADGVRGFNLLSHYGLAYSAIIFDEDENPAVSSTKSIPDSVASFIIGLTPQVKLSEKFTLQGDVSLRLNATQDYTFDGLQQITGNDFIDSTLLTATVGLAYNLGKNEYHADWIDFSKLEVEKENEELAALNARIDAIDAKLLDGDNDGVADAFDLEPNTVTGALVNTKGQTVDTDNDGIPDALKPALDKKYLVNPNPTYTKEEIIAATTKELLSTGLANVYFNTNSDKPLSSSLYAIDAMINYLSANPTVSAELQGYADKRGSDAYNQNLSQRRAQKVKTLIAEAGIDPSRLIVVANGEVESDNSAPSLQLKRKVVFKLK